MLCTAGVYIRNSVRTSLRKKEKTRKEPDAANAGSFYAEFAELWIKLSPKHY